ncbi:helix-turn-helix transcriptional regulator [Halomonas eurihalina]|uniref:Helix-turn-helix transcriptional regulator n=1 Tax=Halomonas eurihalina TaxID=42566 RepID=A0A5D9CYQ0_HALER|nr:helix-turn-helix domain-containing protein [Halomonas eurihalina]MDR5861078.1 AraC family transcriptional regulator [Halomonas eurihalina]TZG35601.1 helix-turn-helix transcriptional regulator [Halomonas eurihalina]
MQQTQARCNPIARTSGEHCHDTAQLMLGWQGAMDYEFTRGGGRLVLGEAAVLPAGEPHSYLGRQEECEVFVIDLDTADPCLRSLEQSCALDLRESLFAEPRTLSLPPTLLPMVEFAAAQVKSISDESRIRLINHQLAMLFVGQFSQLIGDVDATPIPHQRLSAEAMDQFIDQHLESPPNNAELADAMHLGQSQLHLLCQRLFGMSPQQYVMHRRLLWAKYWLRQTKRPIGVIAMDLGFADVSSFSRAFRRRTGYSPRKERS